MRIDVFLALLWWAWAISLVLEGVGQAPATLPAEGPRAAPPGEGGPPTGQFEADKARLLPVASSSVHDAGGLQSRSPAHRRSLQPQTSIEDTPTTLVLEGTGLAPPTPPAEGPRAAPPGEGGPPAGQFEADKARLLPVGSSSVYDAGGLRGRSPAHTRQPSISQKDTSILLYDSFNSLQQQHHDLLAEMARSKQVIEDLDTQNAHLAFLLLQAKGEASVLHRGMLAQETARREKGLQLFKLQQENRGMRKALSRALKENNVLDKDFTKAGNIIRRLHKALSRTLKEKKVLQKDFSKAGDTIHRLRKALSQTLKEKKVLDKDFAKAGNIIRRLHKALSRTLKEKNVLSQTLKEKNAEGPRAAQPGEGGPLAGQHEADKAERSKEENDNIVTELTIPKDDDDDHIKALNIILKENDDNIKAMDIFLKEHDDLAKELALYNVDNGRRGRESAPVVPEEVGPADDEPSPHTPVLPVEEARDTDDVDHSTNLVPVDGLHHTDED